MLWALWSCGRRAGVVQAQRQIHRAFAGQLRRDLCTSPHASCWSALSITPPMKIDREQSSLGLVVAQLSCLWLALASLALFEPIAVAVHFEDVDVVGQPVE